MTPTRDQASPIGRCAGVARAMLISAAWATSLIGAPAALADPNAEPQASPPKTASLGADLVALLDKLGSESFDERRGATDQLLARANELSLNAIEDYARRANLNAEARLRLVQVAREVFRKSPRAALGVRFDSTLRDRVVVNATLPPFPVQELLERGDLILEADGIKIHTPTAQNLMSAIIISHDPGETVKIVIRRGAQQREFEPRLGEFASLSDNGQSSEIGEDRMMRAWRLRLHRMGLLQPLQRTDEVIAADAPAEAWAAPAASKVHLEEHGLVEGPPPVSPGGMPRAAHALPEQQQMVQQMVWVNGQRHVMTQPRVRFLGDDLHPPAPELTPAQELETLSYLLDKARRVLATSPSPAQVAFDPALQATIAEREATVKALERMHDAIKVEVGNAGQPKPTDAVAEPKATPMLAD